MMVQNILLAAAAALLLWAAVGDVRRYLIPNALCAALVGVFILYGISHSAGLSWPGHLAAGGLAFALGTGLFFVRAMGGGDVKLLGATALWAGPDLLGGLLTTTAVAGGVLGVVVLVAGRLSRRQTLAPSGGVAPSAMGARVPYGVAIAAGGLWTLAALAGAPVS